MKTLLKVAGILVLIFIALLFILPMIYKSEIISLTKKEMNKSVAAKIDFEDISLSLFKSFPDFNLSVENLTITGINGFSNDTLVNVKIISISIDLRSVLSSDSYEIKKIKLYDPDINLIVTAEGNSNYDISLPEEESGNNVEPEPEKDESSPFNLSIKKFEIINGNINYIDEQLNMHMVIQGLDHTLSGDLGAENVVLYTKTKINSISTTYDGVEYLSKASVAYNANIDADLKNEIYTLGKNELIVNNLFIGFDGSVSTINDDMNLVLTFQSKGNKFKDILSLIPAIYANEFDGIETEGTFSLDGFVKGIYNDNRIPSFELNASIDNGMFKYPDLPKSVKSINLSANISNKGGDVDNTIINISKFSMLLGNNPINSNFRISTPVSDPDIKARLTGKFNLSEVKEYYPVSDSDEIGGDLIVDISLEGRMSAVENEKFDEFLAMGSVVARNIKYNNGSLKEPVRISGAQMNFSPGYIDLVNFIAKNGENDIQATGKIENYMSYYMNDGTLNGTLIAKSKYLNIDKMIAEEAGDESTEAVTSDNVVHNSDPDTSSLSVIEIPDNINFTVSSTFDKLIYDNIEMEDVRGDLEIKNSTLNLRNLSMETIGGKMTINGKYSTVDINNPKVDFNIEMKNMSIPNAYDQFAMFRKYLPVSKKTTGLFSAKFSLSTLLDEGMMPNYPTLNGGGMLSTESIAITGLNSMNQIADNLNIDHLKNLSINDFMTKFKLEEGKLVVEPTEFRYKNIDAEIAGWTEIDQTIEYNLKLEVPRSEFGSDANKVLDNLIAQTNSLGANFSLPNTIPVNIVIGGTIDNPVIKTQLSKNAGSTTENTAKEIIKKELGNEAAEKAQKIIDDADKQAKYLIDEAKKQAKLVTENADDAVKLLQTETEKQAEALIKEGKKNGFVAEMAAKEAAKQLRKEASNKESDIIKEANKKADDLIKEAEKAASKLKKEAQKEADKVKK